MRYEYDLRIKQDDNLDQQVLSITLLFFFHSFIHSYKKPINKQLIRECPGSATNPGASSIN